MSYIMNKLSTITLFEYLPNEILISCFEYLNAFEIFHSFNQLNYRFYKLIRTISLYLNFQYVRKTTFEQFCTIIKLNPYIKEKIFSLQLSNKDTCGQIDIFLSYFSLQEFSYLQSLTLIQIEENNIEKLILMLPFISKLYSFRLIDFLENENEEYKILSVLPLSNLRILSIPTLNSLIKNIDKSIGIISLTVSNCSLDQLICQLFKYTPLLKYLHIQNIFKSLNSIKNIENSNHYNANYLKQIIIDNFEYTLDEFKIFIKLIPNLKCLKISAFDNISMIDAYQWKYLINTSLIYLKNFQFLFALYCRGNTQNNIIDKFKQFQYIFCWKQYYKYIEYILDKNSAVIYTIPYIFDTYRLTLSSEKYSNKLINNSNTYNNVKDLILFSEAITEKSYHYYFSNITSLKLDSTCISLKEYDNHILRPNHIKSLKMILNLYNLKHLDISSYISIETSSLLEILKEAKQISSITINPFILLTLFNDNELCKYLTQMIKKLNIYKFNYDSFRDLNEIKQFCKIFSNLEQLTCNINQLDQFIILLNQSQKLSTIKVLVKPSDNSEQIYSWFENEAFKLNIIYRINDFHMYTTNPREFFKTELTIWINGSIN